MAHQPPGTSPEDGASLLNEDHVVALRNVHKTYLLGIEGVPALRGVTCEIRRGEFVMIIGKSGSGKTSMLNLIGTIDRPTRGDIRICDQQITSSTPDTDLAKLRLHHLGFVFQTFNLIPAMTALENVELPMILAGKLSSSARKARARSLLERVGMGARVGHKPSMLSGGEQQRVTIARALANNPELLLLDEPTGDLDTANSDNVMNLLCELNANDGVSMVMVTHDMNLKPLAHRVIHMLDGKVQREQHIPAEVRTEALRKLDPGSGDLTIVTHTAAAAGEEGGEHKSQRGEGGGEGGKAVGSTWKLQHCKATVVRSQAHYATVTGYKDPATTVAAAAAAARSGGGAPEVDVLAAATVLHGDVTPASAAAAVAASNAGGSASAAAYPAASAMGSAASPNGGGMQQQDFLS